MAPLGRPNREGLDMERLLAFSLKEPAATKRLRRKAEANPEDHAAQIALGLALAREGCTYEAAALLRPLRKSWSKSEGAGAAKVALEAQTWWSKNWREFAQLRQAGKTRAALKMLGDRAVNYWDFPPLLAHLAHIADDNANLDLAEHLYQRIADLAKQGLPKMEMASFEYVSHAGLTGILSKRGDHERALKRHRAAKPNPGNAMAHEMQMAILLVAADKHDEAMHVIATMLATATNKRSGYSKDIRLDFIQNAKEIAPLRKRKDWSELLAHAG